ncbi:hypothetical protein [Nonomuraea lactucae]|nr:hypothetical protein [Nonomuraea lactucae]
MLKISTRVPTASQAHDASEEIARRSKVADALPSTDSGHADNAYRTSSAA